jgi:hypothetical protein
MTSEKIKKFRRWAASADPYTEEEVRSLPFDGVDEDIDRYQAYMGKKILEEYGIPLTEETDEHKRN